MKKRFLALLVAMVMVLGMSMTAMAASITINSTAAEGTTDKTAYTAWMLLNASIETAPEVGLDGSTTNQDETKVAYYTTSATAKAALEDAGLFTFSAADTEGRYWATPVDGLSAEDVTGAFDDWTEAQMNAAFGTKYTGAQTTAGGSATINCGDDGYYFIKSTLGDQIAVQTIGEVTINTKNSYPSGDKTVPEADANSQIGQEITYTLTVNVPASANDQIVLTDTMSKGLTFVEVVSQDGLTGTVGDVEAAENGATKFTITYTADQVKDFTGTITVLVKVKVNADAAIDTEIPNTLDIDYGNNYSAKPVTTNTQTTHATFDKVDGSTKLSGAKFKLKDGEGNYVNLVEVTAGEVYRVATDADTTTTQEMTTAGKQITINGLDADIDYSLEETKAPDGGYNALTEDVPLEKEGTTFINTEIENNKGTVLPSTGGIGTTIFYIIGAVLVLGAGILLVTRRRMNVN